MHTLDFNEKTSRASFRTSIKGSRGTQTANDSSDSSLKRRLIDRLMEERQLKKSLQEFCFD